METFFFSDKNIIRQCELLANNLPIKKSRENKSKCKKLLVAQMKSVFNKYGDKKPSNIKLQNYLDLMNKKSLKNCLDLYSSKQQKKKLSPTNEKFSSAQINEYQRARDVELYGNRKLPVDKRPRVISVDNSDKNLHVKKNYSNIKNSPSELLQSNNDSSYASFSSLINTPGQYITANGDVGENFNNISNNPSYQGKKNNKDELEQKIRSLQSEYKPRNNNNFMNNQSNPYMNNHFENNNSMDNYANFNSSNMLDDQMNTQIINGQNGQMNNVMYNPNINGALDKPPEINFALDGSDSRKNSSQMNQNNYNQMDQMGQMNQIDQMGQMNQNQMGQMNHNQMGQMNHNQMSQMNHNQMGQMNHNQMGQMNHNQMGQINHNQMGQMNHNQMGQMNHNQMSQMNHNQMGQMNHNQMGQMGQMNHNQMSQMNHNQMNHNQMNNNQMGQMNHNQMGQMEQNYNQENYNQENYNQGNYNEMNQIGQMNNYEDFNKQINNNMNENFDPNILGALKSYNSNNQNLNENNNIESDMELKKKFEKMLSDRNILDSKLSNGQEKKNFDPMISPNMQNYNSNNQNNNNIKDINQLLMYQKMHMNNNNNNNYNNNYLNYKGWVVPSKSLNDNKIIENDDDEMTWVGNKNLMAANNKLLKSIDNKHLEMYIDEVRKKILDMEMNKINANPIMLKKMKTEDINEMINKLIENMEKNNPSSVLIKKIHDDLERERNEKIALIEKKKREKEREIEKEKQAELDRIAEKKRLESIMNDGYYEERYDNYIIDDDNEKNNINEEEETIRKNNEIENKIKLLNIKKNNIPNIMSERKNDSVASKMALIIGPGDEIYENMKYKEVNIDSRKVDKELYGEYLYPIEESKNVLSIKLIDYILPSKIQNINKKTCNELMFESNIIQTEDQGMNNLKEKKIILEDGEYNIERLLEKIQENFNNCNSKLNITNENDYIVIKNMENKKFKLINNSNSVLKLLGFNRDEYKNKTKYRGGKKHSIVKNNKVYLFLENITKDVFAEIELDKEIKTHEILLKDKPIGMLDHLKIKFNLYDENKNNYYPCDFNGEHHELKFMIGLYKRSFKNIKKIKKKLKKN